MSTESITPRTDDRLVAADLDALVRSGTVALPGDPEYETARCAWNLAIEQHPAATAYPADAAEVERIVRAATSAGMRISAQCTGHNVGATGPLDDTLVLRTSRMTGVRVDTDRRRARVLAGTLWSDVVEAAATQGLAALHGSSPNVGVTGYSLGGGISWYGRRLGLQTNALRAIELVTADGAHVRADPETNPELFWALRGGGGSFGVVTALEFDLFPIESAYAGFLLWDYSAAERVLRRWSTWCEDAPDEATTSFRVLDLPPSPDLPETVRGRQVAIIDGAVLDTDERAAALLEGLRELRPEIDTFARVPAASLLRMHMDPEPPIPSASDSSLLSGLPSQAAEAFCEAAVPGSGLLLSELRQLGGALGRPAGQGGALPMLDGAYLLFAVAVTPTPDAAAEGRTACRALTAAMSPWASGKSYLSFVEQPVEVRTGFGDAEWDRLTTVRRDVDPGGVFVANHPVPFAEV